MDVFKVEGNGPLEGEIKISGSKNSALPIFAACLLTKEPVHLKKIPNLSDIRYMIEILEYLGAKIENPEVGEWIIHANTISHIAPYELVRKMRASVCLLGPLVARLKKAEVSIPGGCVIGPRPIDLHLKGLRKLNCEVTISNGYVYVDAANMRGSSIFLGGRNGSTVTGTANLIMAAVLAPGTTRIESAACEPEIIDLIIFLNKLGSKINFKGRTISIYENKLTSSNICHEVIFDRIELGTYMIASALLAKKNIIIDRIVPKIVKNEINVLKTIGVKIIKKKTSIVIKKNKKLKNINITTKPYPGFPTDLQAQLMVLLTQVEGISKIKENIFKNMGCGTSRRWSF